MGCFNETCMVTDLPIREGDRIGVVLIQSAERLFEQSFGCYPTSFWHPVSPVFWGDYDDYGGINLDSESVSVAEDFLDFIRKSSKFTFANSEKKVFDNLLGFHSFSDLLYQVRNGNIYSAFRWNYAPADGEELSCDANITPVRAVFIREDVFKYIASPDSGFEGFARSIHDKYEEMLSEMSKEVDLSERLKKAVTLEQRSLIQSFAVDKKKQRCKEQIFWMFSVDGGLVPNFLVDAVYHGFDFEPVFVLSRFLDFVQKAWHPCSTGRQGCILDEQVRFTKFVADIAKQMYDAACL